MMCGANYRPPIPLQPGEPNYGQPGYASVGMHTGMDNVPGVWPTSGFGPGAGETLRQGPPVASALGSGTTGGGATRPGEDQRQTAIAKTLLGQ